MVRDARQRAGEVGLLRWHGEAFIVALVVTSAKTRQRNARGEGSRLRLEIVEATMRLIDGSDRLTLRAIAREAGIAGPSIYDHFPDLESIRSEVIRSCYEDLIERIRQAQHDVADAVERLEATCLAYARYGADYPNRYALLFRGERDQNEKLAVGDMGAAALQTLVDSIASCREAGRSTSTDPYDDALAVWSAIHGLTTLRTSRPHFARLHRDELMRSVIHRLARITSSPQSCGETSE
jgi:AcrR family transcriptional regulator